MNAKGEPIVIVQVHTLNAEKLFLFENKFKFVRNDVILSQFIIAMKSMEEQKKFLRLV